MSYPSKHHNVLVHLVARWARLVVNLSFLVGELLIVKVTYKVPRNLSQQGFILCQNTIKNTFPFSKR